MIRRLDVPRTFRAVLLIALTIVGVQLTLTSEVTLVARDLAACDAKPAGKARNFLLRDVDNRKWTFS